jgi:hypothetical protein
MNLNKKGKPTPMLTLMGGAPFLLKGEAKKIIWQIYLSVLSPKP